MIRFPKLHIATSVTNRILNIADEIDAAAPIPAVPAPKEPPAVPDPGPSGAQLDAQLGAPPGDDLPGLETDEPATDQLAAAVAAGEDLIRA